MITKVEFKNMLQNKLEELQEMDVTTWDGIAHKLFSKGELVGMLHTGLITDLITDDEYLEYVKKLGKKRREEYDE